jgi:hypothetical protein
MSSACHQRFIKEGRDWSDGCITARSDRGQTVFDMFAALEREI